MMTRSTRGAGSAFFCFLACGRCLAAAVLLVTALAGCGANRAREAADREVYRIIAEKAETVPGMPAEFTIDAPETALDWEGTRRAEDVEAAFGDQAEDPGEAVILGLEEALRIAVQYNRQYQTRKEAVYLQALGLTLERHQYTPIFGGDAGATYTRRTRDETRPTRFSESLSGARGVIGELETLTGQPADLLRQYAAIVEQAGVLAGLDGQRTVIRTEEEVSGAAGVGVGVLLRGGGRIALDLTSNFLTFLTGDAASVSSSVLTGSLSQPLLRGAGSRIAAERLTQAERDMLYELRGYTRFRKEFVVQVCSSYYGVLQNRDIVRNNWAALESFRRQVERERAFATEGRRTPADLGRLEQAELNRENAWTESIRRYKESLDRFKILLGLSTDARIVLDDGELEGLRARGIQHPALTTEDAVRVAEAARLDLYTQYDRVEDAARRVDVAANALLPSLDVLLTGRVDSPPGGNYTDLDFRRARWTAGLSLDPGLDRKAERNALRASMIALERAERELNLAVDNIKLEVREAWRNLEQARRNYEIALKGLELNARRVQEQDLLAELGRATVLDQVDAQNDLTDAQNSLTAALVNHTIARLSFWRDMGILYVKEDGRWEEVVDAATGPGDSSSEQG